MTWKTIQAWITKSWSTIVTIFKIVAIIISVLFVLPVFTSSKETKEQIKEKKNKIKEVKKHNAEVKEEADKVVENAKAVSNKIQADKKERDKKTSKYFPNLLLFVVPLFMLFSTSLEAQDTYMLETSRGTIELVIPAEEDLRFGFIDMASLYIEERYDVDELLEENDRLIESNENLQGRLDETEKELDETLELLEKVRSENDPILQNNVSVGVAMYSDQSLSPQVGYGVVLLDTISVSLFARFPFAVGINVGITW